MKVYVDTNILCSIIGNEFTAEQGLAMEKLALSTCNFVTSKITKDEIDKSFLPEIRGAALFIYQVFGGKKFLSKEVYFATGFGDAPFGTIPFGGGEVENPSLTILRQVFHKNDARHIFQALSNKCAFFLTLDENSILKRFRNNHKNIQDFLRNGNLTIVNPKELVSELSL